MELLKGHESPETAYLVEDYPYGFRLRCKIRYWLEYKAEKGVRFVSQTTNPKREGIVWNKPKASTYCRFGGAMYLDENGHIQWAGAHEYQDVSELIAFRDTYREGLPEAAKPDFDRWIAGKIKYEERVAGGLDWQEA